MKLFHRIPEGNIILPGLNFISNNDYGKLRMFCLRIGNFIIKVFFLKNDGRPWRGVLSFIKYGRLIYMSGNKNIDNCVAQ